MRIASPASKSPSKPVQALTGTLFSLCRTALFFLGDPGPKTTPLCNPNPIIISSNCQVYLCKVPCSCHHARIFPACKLQTDPAGSFYYRAAGSVLSRIFQHLQFRKFSVHQDPLPYAFPAFTCTPSGSDRFLRDPVHADLSL